MSMVIETIQPDGRRTRTRPALKPLGTDGQARVTDHINLAFKEAHAAHWRTSLPLPDLIAEALAGLTEAAARYDEEEGTPFPAYASMVTRHRLMEFVRREFRFQHSWADLPGEDGLPDPGSSEPDRSVTTDDQVAALRRILPRLEFRTLWAVYVEGKSLEEVGAGRGVSKQAMGQVLNRARGRARRLFPALVMES
jgi:RNA polymerase sigma factor (sigma-70 family)